MTKRSMAKTSPEKIKIYDDRNPENKDVQSVQTNELNESAYAFGKNNAENVKNPVTR
ncbi:MULTISPECIES: hypothetical protein [Clostridium]|jgi:hypothetical protein|uniref:hypothetical protein n=1 Tax=Clostridium TaxID=1485 RepID=UPI0002FBB464|nr:MULTISPECIES: hypothetical protein [Clostridium]MDF2502710.1 hypothetical protein [Clostridium sp.]